LSDCSDIPVQDILSKKASGLDTGSLTNYYHLLFQRWCIFLLTYQSIKFIISV